MDELAGTSVKLDVLEPHGRTLVFPIENKSHAPTITTSKYILFGRVDLALQAANGTGIVTSIVLQSDDLDEIDFEWTGNDNAHVRTGYFSKGNTSLNISKTVKQIPVDKPLSTMHLYSIVWTPNQLDWLVDGAVIRTLPYGNNGSGEGFGFPQAPMVLKVGTWVAGSEEASPGTRDFAGGLADFSKGPFNAYLKSITIYDDSKGVKNATWYRYMDRSGLFQNIAVETTKEPSTLGTGPGAPNNNNNSTTAPINPESGGGGGGLSKGAIAGIAVGFISAIGVIAALIFVVLRQQKRAAAAKSTADAKEPESPTGGKDDLAGVDAKPELDSKTFAEMDSEGPPPRELNGECGMRVEMYVDEKHHELMVCDLDEKAAVEENMGEIYDEKKKEMIYEEKEKEDDTMVYELPGDSTPTEPTGPSICNDKGEKRAGT